MTIEISPEAQAAADAYVLTLDIDTDTTRRVLTVGRSSMIHALSESFDLWGILHRDMNEGQTYAEALCGQRSPSYNRNHGHKLQAKPVAIECKKCLKVTANMRADRDAKAAEEVVETPAEEAVTIDTNPVAEGTIPGSIIREFVDGADEWIVETFQDNSQVTRRRRQVSGAWRTDFWGYTAEGKKVPTTSKAAKAAREAGRFTI